MFGKKSGIYIIRNSQSVKVYIGSGENLKSRKTNHFSRLKRQVHENEHLQNSYNKHGVDCFTFEVLEYCSKDVLIEREQVYIDSYDFDKDLYNINPTAGSSKGKKHTPETIAKMKAWIPTEETKKRMSEAHKGRHKGRPMLNNWSGMSWEEKGEINIRKGRPPEYQNAGHPDATPTAKRARLNHLKRKSNLDYVYSTEKKVSKICISSGKVLDTYDSIKKAGTANGIHASNISAVLSGRNSKCGGYKWEYFR